MSEGVKPPTPLPPPTTKRGQRPVPRPDWNEPRTDHTPNQPPAPPTDTPTDDSRG